MGLSNPKHAAIEAARKIGYPVLIKATAGGGGKGNARGDGRIEPPKLGEPSSN